MPIVQIYAALSKLCCVSMPMLHIHVHNACPCPCQCCMSMSMSMYIYIEMLECRTVRHPVSPVPDWKKLTMPEQDRYRAKLTQSGFFLVQYRIKIRDAAMPMPALVSSMPMPSSAWAWVIFRTSDEHTSRYGTRLYHTVHVQYWVQAVGVSYGNTICKDVPIHPDRANSIVVKTPKPVSYSFRDSGP
jgi:hypothetical protein